MADTAHRIGGQQQAETSAAGRPWSDVRLYGALFATAAASFCLVRLLNDQLGPAAALLAIVGSATCGWSWLLSRALFRAPEARRGLWPLALVLALVAAEVLQRLRGEAAAPPWRMIDNAETLLSSTLLLLALIEPLKDIHRGMARAEWRFRAIFAVGYAALLTVAVIGVDGAPPGSAAATLSGPIKVICAALALAGTGLAIRYRRDHPLLPKGGARRRPASAQDVDLGKRVTAVIVDEAVYARPELRLADVARYVGEADYKVTQCITGPLGFRNFNHMINHVRVAAAKRKLADAAFDRLPVLTIALDCGFGSIGPFNRAFKVETGMTPLHFRQAGRRARASEPPA